VAPKPIEVTIATTNTIPQSLAADTEGFTLAELAAVPKRAAI
jgi:hypothetical protein